VCLIILIITVLCRQKQEIIFTAQLINIYFFLNFRHNPIFKNVYREVGILEVFVTCLHRYAALLKEKKQTEDQGKGKYEACCSDWFLTHFSSLASSFPNYSPYFFISVLWFPS